MGKRILAGGQGEALRLAAGRRGVAFERATGGEVGGVDDDRVVAGREAGEEIAAVGGAGRRSQRA